MSLASRIVNIIRSPRKEWEIIKSEASSKAQLINYILVLSLIPSIGIIIRYTLFGDAFGDAFTKLSNTYTIVWAVISYITSVLIILIEASVTDGLSKHFGSSKNFISSLKLVAYANTVNWVAGFISVFPYLGIVGFVAAVYAVYTLYIGLSTIKDVPEPKLVGFSASLILLFIVLHIMFALLSSTILIGLNSVQ